MAGPDGAEQQGLRRGDSGSGADRTLGRHTGGNRAGGGRRGQDVPRARSRSHPARTGNGRVGTGSASTDAHGEGTGMTTTPEIGINCPPTTEAWLAEHSWSRPRWTVEQLVAAKAGRTVSVVLPALNEEETVASVVDTISPMVGG